LLVGDQPCAQILQAPDRRGLGIVRRQLAAIEGLSVALVE